MTDVIEDEDERLSHSVFDMVRSLSATASAGALSRPRGAKVIPVTGDIVAVPTFNMLIIVPATSLATLTVTAPAKPVHMQVFELSTSQYIDALTVVPSSGNTLLNGNIGSLGAGGGKSWVFWQPDNTWYARY